MDDSIVRGKRQGRGETCGHPIVKDGLMWYNINILVALWGVNSVADEEKSKYTKLVTRLKSGNYSGGLNTIQNDLNLPAKTTYAEMEAMLIFMVNKIYAETQEADVALMALGLLTDFSRREERLEESQGRKAYAERREQFLQTTSYIPIKCNTTYEDAKRTIIKIHKDGKVQTKLDTIRGTLNSDTSSSPR